MLKFSQSDVNRMRKEYELEVKAQMLQKEKEWNASRQVEQSGWESKYSTLIEENKKLKTSHEQMQWVEKNVRQDTYSAVGSHEKWQFVFMKTNHMIIFRQQISFYVFCKRFSMARDNSSWSSDAIWRHRSGLTSAQVMACCLMAPSRCLNQCWLIINRVMWHSSKTNFTGSS